MPIDTHHPAYDAHLNQWQRCRDAYLGDDAVKKAGTKYLPQIDAMQTRAEYAAYQGRAIFYEATGKTVDGFVGAISRKPHEIKLPAALELMLADATCDGVAMDELVKQLCAEVLLIGRCGILVDYSDEDRRPLLCVFQAEAITSWGANRVVLSEIVYEQDGADSYDLKAVEQMRELVLIDGVYTVRLWRKDTTKKVTDSDYWIVVQTMTPNRRGKPLAYLPWVWLSITGTTDRIVKPPLLGLVNVCMSHYKLTADLHHGMHFSALPTLYVTGITDDRPIQVGAASAILLPNPQATVGYAEFSGAGLGAIEKAIAAAENRMAALGAAILAAETRQAETATAAHIRHTAETSLLQAAVSAVQAALMAALKIAAEWAFAAGDVAVHLNTDFVASRLDPQTLAGLVAAFQSGALSLSQFIGALVDGDLLPQTTPVAEGPARHPAALAA